MRDERLDDVDLTGPEFPSKSWHDPADAISTEEFEKEWEDEEDEGEWEDDEEESEDWLDDEEDEED